MPVVRSTSVALWCALVLLGCRGEPPNCPVGTVTIDPREIPEGTNQTSLFVEVDDPFPDNGLAVVTEVSALAGAITDPFARETTYVCPFDFSGEDEVCVTTTYQSGDEQALSSDAAQPKRRGPNVFISNPLECSESRCSVVTCPEVKNVCPTVSSLTVEPAELEEGETATITVVASDPDENPKDLVTTLSANYGMIADPTASTTTYTCNPDRGGIIEICVVASDGDTSCDTELCKGVRCPGEPVENTCPIIESVTADPVEIPAGETMSTVRANATDPDEFPVPLRIEWSALTGVFGDRFASETTFTCGAPGPVEVCARANDGDPDCNVQSCKTLQCPSEIPANICPQLFVINGIPRVIPEGETSTLVQTRGQDTDGLPLPLTLTLSALWGEFENTENIQKPLDVVEQNATYICDRPGPVEVCVDATDGACTKTLCDNLVCPDTIPSP
jgi:hypothetical protein